MAFTLDKKQNREAAESGAVGTGVPAALSGFATGATIGGAAGAVAGGIGAVPGALIGGTIGALAAGGGAAAAGAATAKAADARSQKDAWEAEQALLSVQRGAQIDASAAAREAGASTRTPPSAAAYLGAGGYNYSGVGPTSYDRWKTGG